MPSKTTTKRAKKRLREGKRPTTAAGEFVHEEIEHVREGKHGAKSPQQAIAIGLSKARRAGIPLPPPGRNAKARTRRSAERASEVGQRKRKPRAQSRKRSKAVRAALKRQPRSTASRRALSQQARRAARNRRKR